MLLGPGSYSDELKLQVMANYFSEEGFSPSQQANSQNSAQLDKAVFSEELLKKQQSNSKVRTTLLQI